MLQRWWFVACCSLCLPSPCPLPSLPCLQAIDFGISIFCQTGQYIDVRAGTPIYIAPEVLRMNYTLSADIWSLGIVAYQLLTGRLPFAGEEGLEVSEEYMAKKVRELRTRKSSLLLRYCVQLQAACLAAWAACCAVG